MNMHDKQQWQWTINHSSGSYSNSVLGAHRNKELEAEVEACDCDKLCGEITRLETENKALREAAQRSMKNCARCRGRVNYSGKDFESCVCVACEQLANALKKETER